MSVREAYWANQHGEWMAGGRSESFMPFKKLMFSIIGLTTFKFKSWMYLIFIVV